MKSGVRQPNEAKETFAEEENCHILELSGKRDDPVLSIARARVEPGVTTRLHSLDGIAERYLIVAGQGRVELGNAPERKEAVVGPGDVVLIPPDVPQRITNTGDEDLVFYCICTPAWEEGVYQALE